MREKKSLSHALNIKACAKKYAKESGLDYNNINCVVAHMGGGISVTAHNKGKMVDVIDANGEGPFSPERSGGLRVDGLLKVAFSGKYTLKELKKKLTKTSGLIAYLDTNNGMEIKKRIENGDEKAKLVFEAMAYQIAKSIAEMSVALCGKVDVIILTGGLARSDLLVNWIKERVSFISENIVIYAGSNEMGALAEGVLRVLNNEENALDYPGEMK